MIELYKYKTIHFNFMYTDKNMIFEFKTKTSKNKEGVFIGFDKIKFKHVWKIMMVMIKNKIYNLTHSHKKIVSIWAIDDNEKNYNIYVENRYL